MTEIPVPAKSSSSARARSRAGSGSVAGPALKFMGRRMGRECSLKPVEVDVSVRSVVVGLLSLASGAAAFCGVLAAAAGCGGHASADDCAKMMDHYVDLAVQESPGAA